MRKPWSLLVLVLVLIPTAVTATSRDCAYFYSDDFTTNKVESDSYLHSPVIEQPDPIPVDGWLRYEPDSIGNRGIAFHPYQNPDNPGDRRAAYLWYKFPLQGLTSVVSGNLEFDVSKMWLPSTGRWVFAYANVRVHNDSTHVSSGTLDIWSPGHYTMPISLSEPQPWIQVKFYGLIFILDNFEICLDTTTPSRRSTWGELKARYR